MSLIFSVIVGQKLLFDMGSSSRGSGRGNELTYQELKSKEEVGYIEREYFVECTTVKLERTKGCWWVSVAKADQQNKKMPSGDWISSLGDSDWVSVGRSSGLG